MEIPDVLVVTKADLGEVALRARRDLNAALRSLGARDTPVVAVSRSRRRPGIDELVAALDAHRARLDLAARRLAARRAGALADFAAEHGERGLRALGGRRAAERAARRRRPGRRRAVARRPRSSGGRGRRSGARVAAALRQPGGHELGRRAPGERAEVAVEVRLVVVAAVEARSRTATGRPGRVMQRRGALEAQDPGEDLRRQAGVGRGSGRRGGGGSSRPRRRAPRRSRRRGSARAATTSARRPRRGGAPPRAAARAGRRAGRSARATSRRAWRRSGSSAPPRPRTSSSGTTRSASSCIGTPSSMCVPSGVRRSSTPCCSAVGVDDRVAGVRRGDERRDGRGTADLGAEADDHVDLARGQLEPAQRPRRPLVVAEVAEHVRPQNRGRRASDHHPAAERGVVVLHGDGGRRHRRPP